MDPRLILFDVDGTLIDAAGAGRRAMERAFVEVFRLDSPGDSRSVRFAGMTDLDIFDALASGAGIPPARLAREREWLERAYVDRLREEMERADDRRRIIPGARELLEHLARRRGVFLGLVTGNLERGARIKLEPFGLNRFFPQGGFGSDHRDRRQIARLARERLARSAGIDFAAPNVVLVGDTERDVVAARANGFRATAIDSGWTPRAELLRAGADALFDDLSDLPGLLRSFGLG